MEYIIIYKCIFKWTLMKPVNCVLISCLAGNFYFFVLFLLHVSKSFTLRKELDILFVKMGFIYQPFFINIFILLLQSFPV